MFIYRFKDKIYFLLLPVKSTPNQQKTKCMTNFPNYLKKSEFKEKYYTTLIEYFKTYAESTHKMQGRE